MALTLRPYQAKAVDDVLSTDAPTVLVLPTGGGKTACAEAIVNRLPGYTLAIAHRRELISQLEERTGAKSVTIQGLLHNTWNGPKVDTLIIDECHHIIAEEWNHVLVQFPGARVIGLTATPPPELSKVFKRMVVGAYHSDLIREGFLTPCDVFQPMGELQSGVAQHPLTAFNQYGKGQAFIFAPTVKLSKEWTAEFVAAGIAAEHVDGETPKDIRDGIIQRFRDGVTKVVSNVDILTEGFDAPAATTCILARGFGSQAAFLQATGRVLRVFPGKDRAIVIDLTGCTFKHGFPTDDRAYELGVAIKAKESLIPLRVCPMCGFTQSSFLPKCGRCDHVFEKDDPRVVDIRNEMLQKARNENTPDEEKRAELRRWVDRANERGVHYYVLAKKYRDKFGVKPDLGAVCTEQEQGQERQRLIRRFGYGKGNGMFKTMFSPPTKRKKKQ